MNLNQQLTPNFKYYEMVRSDTATRFGIDNIPVDEYIVNFTTLCKCVLERIRSNYKRPWNKHYIKVLSGYRNNALNIRVGSTNTKSQHKFGEAADFKVKGIDVNDVFKWTIFSDIDFDQIISEFVSEDGREGWIHISYKRNGINRNKVSIAKKILPMGSKKLITKYYHFKRSDILKGKIIL
jgi:zinc D-Ala-D-Ala carboxypeptidase